MTPLVTAIVTGLFALAGGFIGARLTRRTEYQKWLRQERSSVFARFLREMSDVRSKATNVIYDENELEGLELDMKITELFVGLEAQANVVRLYLDAIDRAGFSKLINEFGVAHSLAVKQPQRLKRSQEIMSAVQDLFEKSLHD